MQWIYCYHHIILCQFQLSFGALQNLGHIIPDICHKHHKRCLWRKNLSCGENFPYDKLSCGEVSPHDKYSVGDMSLHGK